MGFLEDLLGIESVEDPGAARKKRLDDDAFKRRLLANAAAFSAMELSGLNIGDQFSGN